METVDGCILCGSSRFKVIDAKVHACKCQECGHIFHNPRPTREEVERHYSRDSQYDQWLRDDKPRRRMWKKRLRMIEEERRSGSLLDVGAGTGQFLDLARASFTVAGNEISAEAVRLAGERYGIDLFPGDLADFGPEGGFDVITVFHVLEHVHHPPALIERCKELLTEDGILVIAVPNEVFSLKTQAAKVLSLLKVGRWKSYGASGFPGILEDMAVDEIHLSHFTTGTLVRFLNRSGFRVTRVTLDPANGSSGLKFLVNEAFYLFSLFLFKVARINVYDTIWVTCRQGVRVRSCFLH